MLHNSNWNWRFLHLVIYREVFWSKKRLYFVTIFLNHIWFSLGQYIWKNFTKTSTKEPKMCFLDFGLIKVTQDACFLWVWVLMGTSDILILCVTTFDDLLMTGFFLPSQLANTDEFSFEQNIILKDKLINYNK